MCPVTRVVCFLSRGDQTASQRKIRLLAAFAAGFAAGFVSQWVAGHALRVLAIAARTQGVLAARDAGEAVVTERDYIVAC